MNAQLIALALLALCASRMAGSLRLGHRIECLQDPKGTETRIFESQIRAVIEQLRQMLIEGVNGSPPLDPLDVTDYNLNVNNQLMNLSSTFTAQSQGLAGFEITRLSLSLIGLKLKIGIRFPLVTGSGRYNIDLTSSLISQRVVGDGNFNAAVNDFVFSGVARLHTKLSHGRMVIQIKRLEVDMSLDNFNLQLTGFMNDDQLSQEISERLTNELPTILADNRDRINQAIKDILPYVNDILAGNRFAFDQIKC